MAGIVSLQVRRLSESKLMALGTFEKKTDAVNFDSFWTS